MTGRAERGSAVKIDGTRIPGCHVVRYAVHEDARGRLAKPLSAATFGAAGLASHWAECFWTVSHRGTVRGFHAQLPPSEHDKLVWVVSGASHSVALDLRAGSPAYGETAAVELDARLGKALYLPVGVAHGFQAVEDNTVLVYLVTSPHDSARDSGVRWDSTATPWPLPVTLLSERDRALPALESFVTPFEFRT